MQCNNGAISPPHSKKWLLWNWSVYFANAFKWIVTSRACVSAVTILLNDWRNAVIYTEFNCSNMMPTILRLFSINCKYMFSKLDKRLFQYTYSSDGIGFSSFLNSSSDVPTITSLIRLLHLMTIPSSVFCIFLSHDIVLHRAINWMKNFKSNTDIRHGN